MAKFKKILVPLDGSANSIRGLHSAVEIASGLDSEIIGFHVFQLPLVKGVKITKKMKEDMKEKALRSISPAIEIAKKEGVQFTHHTGCGHVGSEIIKFAQKGKFDMIIIGARGNGLSKESFLGSTTNYILNKSTIPVLIVK
ncbi:universal stress protein [Nitrosopumilus sp. S4]